MIHTRSGIDRIQSKQIITVITKREYTFPGSVLRIVSGGLQKTKE